MRWPILILIPIVLAGLLYWENTDDSQEADRSALPGEVTEISWYCPLVEPGENLILTNPTQEAAVARVTVFSSTFFESEASFPDLSGVFEISVGHSSETEVNITNLYLALVRELTPERLIQVQESFRNLNIFLGALVEFKSPRLIADARFCSSEASDTWYIPAGSTSRDACYFLALLNPFASDAIVDVSFTTDEGIRLAYDGQVVFSGSLLVLDVGSRISRRNQISMNLRTRTGRVVASKLQTFTGKPDALDRKCPEAPSEFDPAANDFPKLWGSQVVVGSPRTSTIWYFPAGTNPLVSSSYLAFNPGSTEALVSATFVPDLGEPVNLELSIPPSQRVSLLVKTGELHPEVSSPPAELVPGFFAEGVGHWASFESINGTGFVVERVQTLTQTRDGVEGGLGFMGAGTEHLILKHTLSPGPEREIASIAIANPFLETIARVSIPGIVQDVEIAPGRRFVLEVSVSQLIGNEKLTSSTPVAVEPFTPG